MASSSSSSSAETDRPASATLHAPVSPRFQSSNPRKIAIAVDLSDDSASAVNWAVSNYLRPGDAVFLLHVRPTSVLYGADWGTPDPSRTQQEQEEDFDVFTTTKANDLAQPLVEANIGFKIRIVKDHDMKERLCLEVERLGLSAVIMGSRGFGAKRRSGKGCGSLGSVSDYCVRHCVCPVVVVRFPDDDRQGFEEESDDKDGSDHGNNVVNGVDNMLHTVPEEDEHAMINGDDDADTGLVKNTDI